MRKLYSTFLLLCLTMTVSVYGQKAKFGNDLCTVQKLRLPTSHSEPDQRTYDLVTKGTYSEEINPYGKKIFGWTLDAENPTVRGVISIYGYRIGRAKRHSEKKQKKDKEGNVTDSWTEYWYTNTATGKATLYVYGMYEPFEYQKKVVKKTKRQEKMDAKAEAEKKDLEDNPFLSAETIAEADEAEEENDIGADEGLTDSELPLARQINIDKEMSVQTSRFRSASKAYSAYLDNQKPKLINYRDQYPNDVYKSGVSNMNSIYGFGPVNQRFYVKKMKGDKHPDAKMWNDACQAVETIFKTFKYNESIEKGQKQFGPIVDYFAGQVDGISEDDKKKRKQKKAAYQNLLNVLYYLDQHDDVIEWSNKFLESKKLDNIAKRMLAKSEREKAHLAFHNMTTRHMESGEEVDLEDIEIEDIEIDNAVSDEEGK